MHINFDPRRPPQSLAARIAGIVLATLAIGAALMFSVVILAVLAFAVLVFWGWFWWKTRALRRTMREQMRAQGGGTPGRGTPGDADVIEGEAVRVAEDRKLLE
jgi:preprotein translocase subunit SecY